MTKPKYFNKFSNQIEEIGYDYTMALCPNERDLIEFLEEYGKNGWELCHVSSLGMYIFKRKYIK